MKIGFDARPLIFTRAGIFTYLYNIVTAMAVASEDQFYLFSSTDIPMKLGEKISNIREIISWLPNLGMPFEKFWQERMLPKALGRSDIDLFHGPRFFVPGGLDCPSVVTVHDLAFKRLPNLLKPAAAGYFDNMLSVSLPRSKKVITPSQFTKSDLVELYQVSEEKIAVIHEGVDKIFLPQKDCGQIDRVKAYFSINGKYILFCGTVEPRKNLDRLLEAYRISRYRDEVKLVITGGFGWMYDSVLCKARKTGLDKNVIFTGYTAIQDMVSLYSGCEAFVFPSLYEGFGLPVLEAMACGAAVIISDTSSLKELFRDAAYTVDPSSVESIAAGIDTVLSDGSLRSNLKAKSIAKSANFSWELAAQQTLNLYRQVLS